MRLLIKMKTKQINETTEFHLINIIIGHYDYQRKNELLRI